MESEVKLFLESLVSESFSSRIRTKSFWGQRMRFNREEVKAQITFLAEIDKNHLRF